MEKEIVDRSEPIKEALRKANAIFLSNYTSQDKSEKDIAYQRWLCKGHIIVLELHLHSGGYQMFKPANESMNVSDDIRFIENL